MKTNFLLQKDSRLSAVIPMVRINRYTLSAFCVCEQQPLSYMGKSCYFRYVQRQPLLMNRLFCWIFGCKTIYKKRRRSRMWSLYVYFIFSFFPSTTFCDTIFIIYIQHADRKGIARFFTLSLTPAVYVQFYMYICVNCLRVWSCWFITQIYVLNATTCDFIIREAN